MGFSPLCPFGMDKVWHIVISDEVIDAGAVFLHDGAFVSVTGQQTIPLRGKNSHRHTILVHATGPWQRIYSPEDDAVRKNKYRNEI